MKKVEKELRSIRREVDKLLADKDIMTGEKKLKELQDRADTCNEMVDEMATYEAGEDQQKEIDAEALAPDIVDLMLDLSTLRLKDRRLALTKWMLTPEQ